MKRSGFIGQWLRLPFQGALLLLVALLARFLPKKRSILIWGVEPLINYRYWSSAMREAGWQSITLATHHYSISQRSDFDRYPEDVAPAWIGRGALYRSLRPWLMFIFIVRNAKIFHTSFAGGPLGLTKYWRAEAHLLRLAGVRTVVCPYGGDAYMYSRLENYSYKHALLWNYPEAACNEEMTRARVEYWSAHADAVLVGLMVEGMPRWDVTVNNHLVVDVENWEFKRTYSDADGLNAPVYVLHTPNHRGVKGTEFLLSAVEDLRAEGLKIELALLEKAPNTDVRTVMQHVDVLAEQFVVVGFGLNAIEGLASGLPVMCNLEDARIMDLFRRYAFLNECPVVSTTPETIKAALRALIKNPRLREQLGRAGRAYAEKYHSFAMAQYLFGETYKSVLGERNPNLMNLFNPRTSEFNKRLPTIEHPLENSRIPQKYIG